MQENQNIAIQKNTIEQLYNKGIDIEGVKLKNRLKDYPIYSKRYTKKKTAAGLYQGYIDLHWSGELYKNWELKINNDENKFSLNTKPYIKNGKDISWVLRGWYGKFEGLTNENFDEFKKKVIKSLKKNYELL